MAKYQVLSPVFTDSVLHQIGETVELSDELAKPLLETALKPIEQPKATAKKEA